MTIRLVTDSAAQLPQSWAAAMDVTVLDLHRTAHDRQVEATSGLAPNELEETYREILEGDDITGIVSVHIASKLSRTWESAAEAAARFGGRVAVIDSQNVGMAVGGAVAQGAQLAANGGSMVAVSGLVDKVVRSSTTWLSVDKMDSLRRGGRVGAAFALFGGVLSTKPILRVRGGNLTLAAKTRTVTKALDKLRLLAREELTRDALVTVQYSGDDEVAENLALEFRKETTFPERVLVVEIDPVLAFHTGDNAVAVSVCPLEYPEFRLPS